MTGRQRPCFDGMGELTATIHVVPHGNKVGKYEDYELVHRLTTFPNLEFEVIESD